MRFTIIIFVLLATTSLGAQRFSLLVEAGWLKGQVDGDKLQGFHYDGYNVGIGSNYTFTNEHFLSVKTTYYDQGSRRKDRFQPKLREGFQLELDMQTIGLELSYKYEPALKPFFLGAGFVRHQLVDIDYEIIDNEVSIEERVFESDQLKSGFNSIKLFYGYKIIKRGSIYLALESSISDMVRYNFFEIQSLVPYSIAAIFTYEIIASKEIKSKYRPGSKSRN